MDGLDREVLELIDEVASHEEKRFDELIRIAGLNPRYDLRFADLRGVDFSGSVLDGWDFTGADLRRASFRDARIGRCDFTDAIGVDVSGALPLVATSVDSTSNQNAAKATPGRGRTARRLVVCCDGTWSDSDNAIGYTNVARLAWAIQRTDARSGREIAQIVFYQSGARSEGIKGTRILSGTLGLGLSDSIRDAYAFICNNYCEGDEIFLFGFSRGAYIARSVGGLIGFAGLIGKRDLDRFTVLWKAYKDRDTAVLASFDTRKKDATIKCIGVWDAVGSVGIPEDLAKFDLLFRKYYGFSDAGLGAHVEHAFHALALDERRRNFAPTLWTQTPEGKARGQELKQVWFAGVHSDVGGGYPVHGTSDIPLAWMASEVSPYLGIDFDYLKLHRDLSSKWALGPVHESYEGFWMRLPGGERVRTPFAADQTKSFEKLHASVADRIKGKGLGADGQPYASKVLKQSDFTAFVAALSPLEESLRWADADVKVGTPPKTAEAAAVKSFFDKVPNWIGITS